MRNMENKNPKIWAVLPGILLLLGIFSAQAVGAQNGPRQEGKKPVYGLPEELKPFSAVMEEQFARQFQGRFPEESEISFVDIYKPAPKIGTYRLLWVHSPARALQHATLPGTDHWGPFAFDGKTLLHLSGQNKNFEKVLVAQQGPVPELFSAEVFAGMVNDFKLNNRNVFRHIVGSVKAVRDFDGGMSGGGYVVDEKVLGKFKKKIAPPRFGKKGDKEVLTYFVLRGWMHETKELVKITVVIGEDFSLEIKEEVLTNKIFSETPLIMY